MCKCSIYNENDFFAIFDIFDIFENITMFTIPEWRC